MKGSNEICITNAAGGKHCITTIKRIKGPLPRGGK